MVRLINWLKGYLRIRVSGLAVERFMNLCGNKNLLLWEVRRYEGYCEMYISLQAFRQLRPIVRKTHTKVVILQREGLPFFVSNLNKRKVFLFGGFFAVWFWQISGNFVWQIEISGNYQITTEQLSDYLEKQQIHIGMLKKQLDIEGVEKELRIAFPEIIWSSGKIDGTTFLLDVKEGNGFEISVTEQVNGQYDLVAHVDGKIKSIIVRSGVPLVKQGDAVTKDMVLVEGKIPVNNDDGTVREYLYLKADADIFIEHSIAYKDTLQGKYIEKSYTGRSKEVPYVRIGESELVLRRNPSYLIYDTVIQENTHQIFKDLKIPFLWGTYTHREYLNMETLYTEEEAAKILQEKFLQFLATLSEKGVQIIEKDVKIVENDDVWSATGEIIVAEPVTTWVQVEVTEETEVLEKE
ncbi:MAG: sporulation protein YqfD [Lachnospiraceae bacterium]|nr:sporulation protein YqfD [Lachnospiraceae bacterium]